MRLIVQSTHTGAFLVAGPDGTPMWERSLKAAGGGVFDDPEAAIQLIRDHCDPWDQPEIVDLDKLGTSEDL